MRYSTRRMPTGSQKQRKRTFFYGSLLVAALSALLWSAWARTRPVQYLEDGTYDARVRLAARPATADQRIVILDIDNATFDDLKEKLGRWPWTRRVWTEVIRYVQQGRPAAIAIDAIYGGVESAPVDDAFAGVIRSAGNVVLAYTVSPTEEVVDDPAPLRAKLQDLAGRSKPSPAATVGTPIDLPHSAINTPLHQLSEAAAGLGDVVMTADSDGTNRAVPLSFLADGRAYPTLAVRTVELASASPLLPFVREGSFARAADGVRYPVDATGRMLLHWHGDAFTYQRIPLWQMICSIYPAQCPEGKVYYPPAYFQGKIVLLGASATGSYEARTTPFSSAAPGFILHAAAIDNLLHHDPIHPSPASLLWLLTALLSGLAAFAMLRARRLTLGGAGAVLIAIAYLAVTYFVYAKLLWWVPVVAPLLALATTSAGIGALKYATTGRELRRTRGTLDRYVAPQLVNYVLDNLDSVNLAGEKRELTVFFSDVRNFTTLTEGSEPMELIALLDEYLSAMTEIIFKYDGIVDKFIGDGIMAYWGAFTPGSNHALQGARASIEMLHRLDQLNRQWTAEGRKCLDIGIGLNTGTVVFGNVGKGKKIEFTVIGDAVNLAARLESTNKEFGTHIIVSKTSLERLGDLAQARCLGSVKVKGKTVATEIYELLAVDGVASPHAALQATSGDSH